MATLGDYFNNEAGKNITCPYLLNETQSSGSMAPGAGGSDPQTSTGSCAHQFGSLPPNGSVSWCYFTPASVLTGSGSSTLCIDRTGINRTEEYSAADPLQQLRSHLSSITVLEDGRLSFPEVSFFFDGARINCTVFDGDGRTCGQSSANIELLKRSKQYTLLSLSLYLFKVWSMFPGRTLYSSD